MIVNHLIRPLTEYCCLFLSLSACQQDCDPAAGSPPNPACHGTPDDISTTLFATPEACCAAKLGWIDDDVCKDASLTGAGPTATDSPGTGEWRKNDAWSYCVLGKFVVHPCWSLVYLSTHHLTDASCTPHFY